MKTLLSKELLSEVFGIVILDCKVLGNGVAYNAKDNYPTQSVNIYELVHMNLKQWAKFKNVFGKIDWSEEPEQIFKKAEELRNEIS